MDKTQAFIAKWERTRQMGKKAYMMRYGIIAIGMVATLLITLPELINQGKLSVGFFVARLLLFPTIGAMIVGQRWDSREQKYAKLKGASPAR